MLASTFSLGKKTTFSEWSNIKCYTCGPYYKCLLIVIYDRNESGLYCKTLSILAEAKTNLAWLVNYDCKVCCKLKHTFMIVNYDHKTFIVQATGWAPTLPTNIRQG